jgi:hypothetical protein
LQKDELRHETIEPVVGEEIDESILRAVNKKKVISLQKT